MPLYEVVHSVALNATQKHEFAKHVTELHGRAFKAPSLFVNVVYRYEDVAEGNYFVAGEVKQTSTNRIIALVRTSEARRKEHFDKLAKDIEKAWYQVLSDAMVSQNGHSDTDTGMNNSNLIIIGFVPVLSAREIGLTLPRAGEEKEWVRESMEEFRRRAKKGDRMVQDMLTEIDQRDDLEDWRAYR